MIILRLLVDPQASGQLKTTATVSAENPDPVPSNNTADAIILANG